MGDPRFRWRHWWRGVARYRQQLKPASIWLQQARPDQGRRFQHRLYGSQERPEPAEHDARRHYPSRRINRAGEWISNISSAAEGIHVARGECSSPGATACALARLGSASSMIGTVDGYDAAFAARQRLRILVGTQVVAGTADEQQKSEVGVAAAFVFAVAGQMVRGAVVRPHHDSERRAI